MFATAIPRSTLLYVVKQLPAGPQLFARLGRSLLDASTGLAEITALLRCDVALTARILRIANSVAYNPYGTPFATLEQALARVGLKEVYRITGIAAFADLADQDLPLYGLAGMRVRENSLLTALLMEILAQRAALDPQIAYTAGLLRSVGKIALDRLTRDRAYSGVRSLQDGELLADGEENRFGINNCETAAFILNEWRFPEMLVQGIGGHYSPEESPSQYSRLLNLAGGLAEDCGLGLRGETSYWQRNEQNLGGRLAQLQLDEAKKLAFERFAKARVAIS